MSSEDCIEAQAQKPESNTFTESDFESLIDTKSLEQTWSFMDVPSSTTTTTIDEDPHQPRTAVKVQQALCRHLYRELTLVKQVGEGAVFQVGLYFHRDGRQFAVKHAKLGAKRRDGGNNPAGGIFSALREVQVNFHDTLKRHQNIVNIMGWDWSDKRAPVIITEYAAKGTLRDFLLAKTHSYSLKRNLALDVASGLSALHASDIAHGDVKLENTLVFPHGERSWYAKVSDFSHSVFGVSTKRKSTYPGSGLYNAPEIRRRDTVITSDLLPKCETFSYGLLVWELLKDGKCFFETEWLRLSTATTSSMSSPIDTSRIMCLESLPPNALLDRAMAFLDTCHSIAPYGKSEFVFVFEHTLKDRGIRRSDLSSIASMLDLEDRATIYYQSTTIPVQSITFWEFSPWRLNVPWMTQIQTVQEFERLIDDYVQPTHAEWHLLLSRCYAEGFGVKIDYSQMLSHLRKAAEHESVEARFMLLLIEQNLQNLVPTRQPSIVWASVKIGGNPIFDEPMAKAIQEIKNRSISTSPGVKYATMVQLWFQQTSSHIYRRPFTFQGNTYFWTNLRDSSRFLEDVNTSQFMLWDVVITYESLENTLQTKAFFDACASIAATPWWINAMAYARDVQSISQENREAIIHSSLISALQNGHVTFAGTVLAQLDSEHLSGFASRVSRARTKTPLHFLPFIKDRIGEIEALASKLSSLGFNEVANQAISGRIWLQPLGIELHGAPLHMAVRLRSLAAVKALMRMGANALETSTVAIKSPLELAICLNLSDIVGYMIDTLDSGQISTEKILSYVVAVGTVSSKGIFDKWLLHPNSGAAAPELKRTLEAIQQKHGSFSKAFVEECLIQSLRSGWKSSWKFETLWEYLVMNQQIYMDSHSWIRNALDIMEQLISDDPDNRSLLRFLLCCRLDSIDWKGFLSNYRYDSDSGPQTESLMFRWAKHGYVHNLKDLRLYGSRDDWNHMVEQPTTTGRLPIDAAILTGCLATFEIFSKYYPLQECLKRAIDLSASGIVTHIIQSQQGTIFCDIGDCTTALHYAAATSNIIMIQHLMSSSLLVPPFPNYIKLLRNLETPLTLINTNGFRIFQWDPVFNMRDSTNFNRTAFEISTVRGDILALKALLRQDLNSSNETVDSKNSILSFAIKMGRQRGAEKKHNKKREHNF